MIVYVPGTTYVCASTTSPSVMDSTEVVLSPHITIAVSVSDVSQANEVEASVNSSVMPSAEVTAIDMAVSGRVLTALKGIAMVLLPPAVVSVTDFVPAELNVKDVAQSEDDPSPLKSHEQVELLSLPSKFIA